MYDIAWAGRVLEESNESFSSTLAEIKDRMRMTTSTTQRFLVTTAWTQGNMRGGYIEIETELVES